jgi:dihydroflavonol-4-reductase
VKIAITGGTGYIGAHMVRALLAAGHEVELLVPTRPCSAKLMARLSGLGDVRALQGDVRDPDTVAQLLTGKDAVVHAAGVVGTDDRQEKLMWEINAHATEGVLVQACNRGLDPIVSVSSYAALFPPPGSVIGPDTPTAAGKTAYARTKAYGDRVARRLQDGGAPVVLTYPSSVVGPAFETPPGVTEQGWVSITKSRMAPRLRGAGMMMIDVRDVADVHTALMRPGRGPKRYVCGGTMLTFDEMISALELGTGHHVRRIPMSSSVFRGLGRVSDTVNRVLPIGGAFSYEAARLITAAIPTDDSLTLTELGLRWRSPVDAIVATFRGTSTSEV